MKVVGVVGWKNSGKTGLVERLVAAFTARGFAVSTVKHAHHDFDVDQPGRDSFRHRKAGAHQVMLSSAKRWALMTENRAGPEGRLHELLRLMDPVDIVIVEGFKAEGIPKIEAHRQATNQPLIARTDPMVRAVAADIAPHDLDCPVFDLNDTAGIADFVQSTFGLQQATLATDGSADKHALPKGVDWLPVDDVLTRIRQSFAPVVVPQPVALDRIQGRVLARDVVAERDSPPCPNSAVDGYGFAHAGMTDPTAPVPLTAGRAGPGELVDHAVPAGHAIRMLTGAPLPPGVDTVALQENVTLENGHLVFDRLPRPGANTRAAGEDKKAGEVVLQAGRILSGRDAALAASVGAAAVTVYSRLRVGVLSTGNELVPAGQAATGADIYDANRPMLMATLAAWGCEPIDLGHARDTSGAVADALDRGAPEVDMILTSGGASAGDEDHIAALLRERGHLDMWRIAVKPGRPLAIGRWRDTPVFGLPGNPVAAFVCTLIFVRPAVLGLSGAPVCPPQSFQVPAGFSKSKRPGRREFLRARIGADGRIEVFSSEGSGRVSGLSWAEGLVELPDGAMEITPGDPVTYLPFSAFGLGDV